MNGHQKQKETSAKMIEDAFFQLIEGDDYAKITVSEIAEMAGVARRTFYRLYDGKEAVLRAWIEKVFQEYRRECGQLQNYDIGRIAGEYFSFWYRYRERLMLLHRNGLDVWMLYHMAGPMSQKIIGQRIAEQVREQTNVEYFMLFSAGGFANLLYSWIANGMEETPEEYAQKVSRSILGFIQPAIRL
ncbi:MAG: TetR/AcrR family transcriptional regulator [Coprococcus sp.]